MTGYDVNCRRKKALSKYRLDKAQRLLGDAELLLRKKRWESAVNRSYYAAPSAAKAPLVLLGVDPKTHEGVKTMVNKELVLEGFLSKEHGKWFRELSFEREDADYADYVDVDAMEAEQSYTHAAKFIDKIRKVVLSLTKQV